MQSLLDIYWGYVLDKILCKAGLFLGLWNVAVWQCGNLWAHFLHTPRIYHSKPFPLEIIVTSLDWAWSLHYQSYQPSWGVERYHFLSWRMSSIQPDCCHHTFTDRDWLDSIRTSCWHDRTQQSETSHQT